MPVISKPPEAGSERFSHVVLVPGDGFEAASAARFYTFAGIALIAAGLLFGDIFAVFILHQNAGRQGAALLAAERAVEAGDPAEVNKIFSQLGGELEDRGTKVDAHVHMIDAGYLALLLALVQPYVGFTPRAKKLMAILFIVCAVLLPLGIFLIHYVGLAGSPFAVIGWASVVADSAGALMIAVLAAQLWGVFKFLRQSDSVADDVAPPKETDGMPRRALLSGGTLLILLGFLQGAYYAGTMLYAHERMETSILQRMIDLSASGRLNDAAAEVANFGNLAGTRAVNIAAHSHIIEFGLLAILLSFVQHLVLLSDKWKRRWVKVFLGGSVILPFFVLLEVRFGLIAGGIADIGGLMVLISLVGMLVGIVRHSGAREGATAQLAETQLDTLPVSTSRKVLLIGGMVLAACGMLYGLHYALFVEHQTLDQMGGSLAHSFSAAATRNVDQSRAALQQYAETKYDYVRQVDAHSHWTGLAMLIFVMGVIFNRVNFRESNRLVIALGLLAGGVMFPLAVLLQTYNHGAFVWKAFSIVGSGLVIASLAATGWGFARSSAVEVK